MSQPSKKVQPTANPSGEQRRMHSGSVPGVGSMGVPTTSTGPHATNLDTLRKIAEAATPGPWTEFHENGTPGEYEAFNCPPATGAMLLNYAPMEQRAKDSRFIATFDPPTVLALLSRLEQAEQAVERVRTLTNELSWLPNHVAIVQRYRNALDGDGRD